MKCPFCGYNDSKVLNSRPTDEGSVIRRRRECPSCQKRFTTYEKFEELPIMVIKRDESREIFNKNKIMNGLIRATQKRPISMDDLKVLIEDVENSIYSSFKQEIKSSEIGEMLMERLKKIDDVSYVRFASVYKEFNDIDTFMSELKKLIDSRKDSLQS